ncbi:MAG: hypothetical protein KAG66_20985, partial [Methylococcales bacterium]|nr:hypothetical protein [Methylococcales bacterium]
TVLAPACRSVAPSDPDEPEPVASRTADKDNLTAISGIGLTYNQALVDAGITTFDALARLTDEEVIAIVKPAKWQSIKVDAWIEEAAGRADDKRWS